MAEVDTTPSPPEQVGPIRHWIVIVLLGPLVGAVVMGLMIFAVDWPANFVRELIPVILAGGWVMGLVPAGISAAVLYRVSPRLHSRRQRVIACCVIGALSSVVGIVPAMMLIVGTIPSDLSFALGTAFAGAVALLVTGVRWSVR